MRSKIGCIYIEDNKMFITANDEPIAINSSVDVAKLLNLFQADVVSYLENTYDSVYVSLNPQTLAFESSTSSAVDSYLKVSNPFIVKKEPTLWLPVLGWLTAINQACYLKGDKESDIYKITSIFSELIWKYGFVSTSDRCQYDEQLNAFKSLGAGASLYLDAPILKTLRQTSICIKNITLLDASLKKLTVLELLNATTGAIVDTSGKIQFNLNTAYLEDEGFNSSAFYDLYLDTCGEDQSSMFKYKGLTFRTEFNRIGTNCMLSLRKLSNQPPSLNLR